MKKILNDRSFKIAIVISILFLGLGFAFLHFEMIEYGWAFFILLPIVLGVSIGALPNKKIAAIGVFIGTFIFFLLLLIGKLEGFICVLMTIPIIIPMIFLGAVISHLLKRFRIIKSTNKLNTLIIPFFIFLSGIPLENKKKSPEIINIETEVILPYSNIKVYNAIKNVDTLDVNKPFLMKLDLPIPQKCILEKEEVGALRTCYFEGGKIVERVTALEKGKLLKMDVIDYELTGRKWLGFKEAIYTFDKVNDSTCKMTRITTYTSKLYPRKYWKPLEKIGIEQEHLYVIDNLKKDLKNNYQYDNNKPHNKN